LNEHSFQTANELTFKTVQFDIARLRKILEGQPVKTLHLDLQNVIYCDSAGLALLIEAKRLCKQHNTTLELKGLNDAISSLAEFCGVAPILCNLSETK
jgi:phospholipid transport system transporter-binding protein